MCRRLSLLGDFPKKKIKNSQTDAPIEHGKQASLR